MPASAKKKSGSLRPIQDRRRQEAVMQAISEYDVASSDSWSDLDELSTHTQFESAEAVPEGLFETDAKFSAAATIYVTLQYGSGNDEGFSTSDSFPAQVEGHFEGSGAATKAVIDSFEVDTSSFDA